MGKKTECTDYWCAYYDKGSEKCDHCIKKNSTQDKTDISTVLKRRSDRLIDSTMGANKGQER